MWMSPSGHASCNAVLRQSTKKATVISSNWCEVFVCFFIYLLCFNSLYLTLKGKVCEFGKCLNVQVCKTIWKVRPWGQLFGLPLCQQIKLNICIKWVNFLSVLLLQISSTFFDIPTFILLDIPLHWISLQIFTDN